MKCTDPDIFFLSVSRARSFHSHAPRPSRPAGAEPTVFLSTRLVITCTTRARHDTKDVLLACGMRCHRSGASDLSDPFALHRTQLKQEYTYEITYQLLPGGYIVYSYHKDNNEKNTRKQTMFVCLINRVFYQSILFSSHNKLTNTIVKGG